MLHLGVLHNSAQNNRLFRLLVIPTLQFSRCKKTSSLFLTTSRTAFSARMSLSDIIDLKFAVLTKSGVPEVTISCPYISHSTIFGHIKRLLSPMLVTTPNTAGCLLYKRMHAQLPSRRDTIYLSSSFQVSREQRMVQNRQKFWRHAIPLSIFWQTKSFSWCTSKH